MIRRLLDRLHAWHFRRRVDAWFSKDLPSDPNTRGERTAGDRVTKGLQIAIEDWRWYLDSGGKIVPPKRHFPIK